ncbi:MAG: hypothetical protein PHU85_08580, partial [Phycisphaerae bacterium]|nr:hypothetical protein [Phycisphaerae bacterium]
ELAVFEFPEYCKPGYVPFAFTAGGDYWCWAPHLGETGHAPVLLCYHDCNEADFWAPDLAGTAYRQVLYHCAEPATTQDERQFRCRLLRRYVQDLRPIWRAGWLDRIQCLAAKSTADERLLAWGEAQGIIAADLGSQYVERRILWMED